ncbi:pyridoxamine 5'-phosphate oxidase [Rhodococcus sp. WMMA185]|uniref:pyridoxine/pyridoxamine 5'-phosphate oxidase n=1 Tax=Rhodococcus sp. WMMA185 TaxID=679318 RepID=UPI00087914FE|nr:pyridoxal 5'-phosphate synthase [Rhodococcus sp. WMMA185]AOW91855.1 pyridoxamine 5'-phosphate oxidase [Rhodococcus sp. WMMA185]
MSTEPDPASYPDTRAWIRALPALSGVTLPFAKVLPDTPCELFLQWIREAVAADVPEPQAAALSTVDADGRADSRFLLLKDVSETGFWFSGDAHSPKGRDLASNSSAALTFYWRELGRQVRVRGSVKEGEAAVSARDFRERSVTARAVAAASRQSEVLGDPAEYDRVVAAAVARIEADPDFVSDSWRAWCLVPDSVEFWQADPGRRHQRRLYRRGAETGGWTVAELWP